MGSLQRPGSGDLHEGSSAPLLYPSCRAAIELPHWVWVHVNIPRLGWYSASSRLCFLLELSLHAHVSGIMSSIRYSQIRSVTHQGSCSCGRTALPDFFFPVTSRTSALYCLADFCCAIAFTYRGHNCEVVLRGRGG